MKDGTLFLAHRDVLAVALTVLALAVAHGHNQRGWSLSDDEGTLLYQAWRVGEGDWP